MTSPTARLALLGSFVTGLMALAVCLPASLVFPPRAIAAGQLRPLDAEALQVVADVVLIESQCRQLAVDYGRLFDFAERHGIGSVDIMPTGERRAAFEAAYARRAREMGNDRLCGALAAERAATIPGVFTPR